MSRLDLKCAEIGQQIGRKLGEKNEKLLANTSAVLASQGLCAMAVYLRAQMKRDDKKKVDKTDRAYLLLLECGKLVALAAGNGATLCSDENEAIALMANISVSLPKLLLARRLIIEALSYAKYHLKVEGAGK